MKTILRHIVLGILTWCARRRLARMRMHGTRLIGITGSIGKTTCKEAIAHVLGGSFQVLSSAKSYNTEFGLSLTILELRSEFSSVVGWTKNIGIAIWRSAFSRVNYDFLILEMGVDKPGDMDELLKVLEDKNTETGSVPPLHCGIFTGVHSVHMAEGQFANMDEIFEEKVKLVRAVGPDGMVFLNEDDERCRALGRELGSRKGGAKVVMYGDERAKLRASQVRGGWDGLQFEASYGEVRGSFTVPILGVQHVGSLLPAIGCALLHGMYMDDIATRMGHFQLPPGRLTLLEGKHDAWIIDSSYNASPDAVRAALVTLSELAQERQMVRRIFIFGNMNELGTHSEQEHRGIAAELPGNIDLLLTIGDMAAMCADEAIKTRILPREQVQSFPDAMTAAEWLEKDMKRGDLILVKGSQNTIRLERLIKAIMKHPERAKELLARQDWNSV